MIPNLFEPQLPHLLNGASINLIRLSQNRFNLAQMVKNLPAVQETWVQSLGLEDPLKKGMATHSSVLAWRIPQTEEPGQVRSMGSQTVRHN